jgi:hypothetical protein
LVFDNQFFDLVDLARRKPVTAREAHRIEPQLRLTIVALHVHMWRLVSIASVKEQPLRAAAENCGHSFILRPATPVGNANCSA